MQASSFFRARLLRSDGRVVERPFFLNNVQEVRREVNLAGGTVLDIQALQHGAWWQREIYTGEYKREFLRSVMFFVETGISPTEALMRVMQAERNARKRSEFAAAIEVIRAGGRFAEAVEHTGMFDPTMLLLLRAGELIGIRKVVPAIEALMQARANLAKFMGTIVSVLGLEVFTAVSSAMAIKFYALPYILNSFTAGGNASPAEKAAANAMAVKLGHVGVYVDVMLAIAVLVTLALVGGALLWFFHPPGRERLARGVRLLPGGRALVYHAHLSDGFGVASSLLESGIAFGTVLHTLATATRNVLVARYWHEAAERVRQGLPVAAALADPQVLDENEIVALNAHRNVAQLARVARSISERRAHAAQIARLRFVKLSTLLTVAYIMAVVGAAVWMMMVQDEGMGMMMKALG